MHGVGIVEVPDGLMPRMALGYLFFPLARVLCTLDLDVVTTGDIDEALAELEALGAACGTDRPTAENEAKRVALAIERRWPAIYGGPVTGPVAYRWKTDF